MFHLSEAFLHPFIRNAFHVQQLFDRSQKQFFELTIYQICAIEFINAALCVQLIELNVIIEILFQKFNGRPAIVFIRGAMSHISLLFQ